MASNRDVVTVSPKYQVVIPKAVRQQVPLHTGQKLAVVVKEGVITLVPDRPLASFRDRKSVV